MTQQSSGDTGNLMRKPQLTCMLDVTGSLLQFLGYVDTSTVDPAGVTIIKSTLSHRQRWGHTKSVKTRSVSLTRENFIQSDPVQSITASQHGMLFGCTNYETYIIMMMMVTTKKQDIFLTLWTFHKIIFVYVDVYLFMLMYKYCAISWY